MKERHALPEDKRWLVQQFLRLSPAQRMRYAVGMIDSALRVNPNLLKNRLGFTMRLRLAKRRRIGTHANEREN
jgi:hypothetical protein